MSLSIQYRYSCLFVRSRLPDCHSICPACLSAPVRGRLPSPPARSLFFVLLIHCSFIYHIWLFISCTAGVLHVSAAFCVLHPFSRKPQPEVSYVNTWQFSPPPLSKKKSLCRIMSWYIHISYAMCKRKQAPWQGFDLSAMRSTQVLRNTTDICWSWGEHHNMFGVVGGWHGRLNGARLGGGR